MIRSRKLAVPVLAVVLVAGCGGSAKNGGRTEGDSALRGGTLQVGLTNWAGHEQRNSVPGSKGRYFYAFDPQEIRYPDAFEFFRCCLLRTLLSYNGHPTGEGGAQLRPDLATSLPTVSADGLTWTFHLKSGLHYAPPLEKTEIVAQDVIRALEREFSPAPQAYRKLYPNPVLGHYVELYDGVIEGTKAFQAGKAANISGLEAPDRYTLVVHLVKPTGDLGYAFSMPATAPIPANPGDPGTRLGVAQGHSNGYGRFLVASGPYMFAGSAKLDFSLPPARQKPVSGYVPGTSFTFVRNPSWDPHTDSLRKAYADRIEFTLLPPAFDETTRLRLERRVDAGRLDLLFDTDASDARLTGARRGQLYRSAADDVYYFALNVALPPFDDVHVRKAANLVLDKARIQGLLGNPLRSRVATHLAPGRKLERIASRVGERTTVLDVARVTHFVSKDKLTFAVADGREHVVDFTLSELEERLDPRRFARIHRATIVNIPLVHELFPAIDGGMLVRLKDAGKTELAVARDRVRDLKERLGI